MRKSGILLHISSLPSKYGIGTFGEEAYEFVDFLKEEIIHSDLEKQGNKKNRVFLTS